MKRSNPLASQMVFGKVPQYVIDEHYNTILATIKDGGDVSFLLACINALKDRPGYGHIRFAAQNAVMSGWLTINDKNEFAVKETA
jgi:hypothetical protein